VPDKRKKKMHAHMTIFPTNGIILHKKKKKQIILTNKSTYLASIALSGTAPSAASKMPLAASESHPILMALNFGAAAVWPSIA
jgi:hypothetical protein